MQREVKSRNARGRIMYCVSQNARKNTAGLNILPRRLIEGLQMEKRTIRLPN